VTGGVLCGDCTQDGVIDVGDVVCILNYLFKDYPPPEPLCILDVNCDGVVDLGDAIYLINYLFRNGDPPCSECCSGKAKVEEPQAEEMRKLRPWIKAVPQRLPHPPKRLEDVR
jgi:hypothetical protein